MTLRTRSSGSAPAARAAATQASRGGRSAPGTSVTVVLNAIVEEVKKPPRSVLDRAKIIGIIEQAQHGVHDALHEMKGSHPSRAETDQVFEQVTALYEGKVGDPYPPDVLNRKLAEAKKRFEQEVPPGYAEKKKEPERYGDIVLWFQLLDFAKLRNEPLIFVTEDAKEDWWEVVRGKTQGPRPELVQEMAIEANTKFHMYRLDEFMKWAENFLGLGSQPEAIEEVQALTAALRQEEYEALRDALLHTALATTLRSRGWSLNGDPVGSFSAAVSKAWLAARGGTMIPGEDGEFPRSAWATFTTTLAQELGPSWLIGNGPPPGQDVNYNAIYTPTNVSVSAVIRLGERNGNPIYQVTAIGTP